MCDSDSLDRTSHDSDSYLADDHLDHQDPVLPSQADHQLSVRCTEQVPHKTISSEFINHNLSILCIMYHTRTLAQNFSSWVGRIWYKGIIIMTNHNH